MRSSTESEAGRSGRYEAGACIQVDVYEGEHLTEPVVRIHSTETGTVMQARISEWRKFVAEVKAGDWDHVDTDYEIEAGTNSLAEIISEAKSKAR